VVVRLHCFNLLLVRNLPATTENIGLHRFSSFSPGCPLALSPES
jgi:hypothetical protein